MPDDRESKHLDTTKPMTGLEKTPRSPSIDVDDTAPDPAPFGAEATPPPAPAQAAGKPAAKSDAKGVPAKSAPAVKRSRLATWARRVAVTVSVLFASAAVGAALVIRHYEADLPS